METQSTRAAQFAVQVKQANGPVSEVRDCGDCAATKIKLELLCQELLVLKGGVLQCMVQQWPMNISRPARTIRWFRCSRTDHLQSHCRVNLDKRPRANLNKMRRAIHCNRCGFCHIERLCRRASVPVAESAAVCGNSINKINNEESDSSPSKYIQCILCH